MSSRPFPLLSLVIILVLISALAFQLKVVASPDTYYPTRYDLLGATAHVSGALADLHSDSGVYMAFRSYASKTSAQALCAHQETTTIASINYYLLKLESADASGTSLSAFVISTGRQLWGKFVYPLTGVTSIPASTWTFYYRTWFSGVSEEVSTNSPSSVLIGTWSNKSYAFASDDNYAYTHTDMAIQEYGNYGFNFPSSAIITKVEVGYEAYTADNERIEITLSWNDGNTWAKEYKSTDLGTTDPDTVTWIDFTDSTGWTADKLSDANFRIRVKGVMRGEPNYIYLDWIPVRVTYVSDPPSAHTDVDILIRKSDGTIRQTIATDVADSANLSTTIQTLSGIYSWPGYTVVKETDYLEIDYYLDVSIAKSNVTVYFRIDDNALTLADQTRATGIILPSEYTMEVEFTGSSDTDYWSQLVWTVDSAWTTDNVSVTLQLYDYTLGAYPTSGDGYIAYTSSATPNTDENKSQVITANLTNFQGASGNWKMKIKGVKSTTSQFEFKVDLIEYEVTSVAPSDIAVLNVTVSSTSVYLGDVVAINVTVRNEGGTIETFNVTLYYDSTAIGIQTVTDLEPGKEITLRFSWDTTNVTPDVSYGIKAEANIVTGETDTVDNAYTYGTLRVKSQVTSEPFDWRPTLPYLIPILLGGLVFLVVGISRKKREAGEGFEFFNEITDGGIPDAYSVMIIGDASSGKSVLCQQLAYNYLTQGKSCVYVTYDIFPFEVRQNMKNFQWDISPYEQDGAFKFVDSYSSMAGLDSEEKYYVEQPFSLSDLGITMSAAIDDVKHKSIRVFLDSTAPLFARVDPSKITEFLQDRSAKIKGDNGAFFFTVGKGTVPSDLMRRLEEIVDCIIELDVHEEKRKTWKRMRIRKLRGRRITDAWISFKIELKEGISFFPPKGWSKNRKS